MIFLKLVPALFLSGEDHCKHVQWNPRKEQKVLFSLYKLISLKLKVIQEI